LFPVMLDAGRKLFRTSSFKLALAYASFFLASVLVLYGVIYWFATDYAAQDEINEIAQEFDAIQDEARLAGDDRLPQIIANHLRARRDVRAVYLLEDPAGRKIAGNIESREPALGPMMLRLSLDGQDVDVRASGYRMAHAAISTRRSGHTRTAPNAHRDRTRLQHRSADYIGAGRALRRDHQQNGAESGLKP
jgi:hypothetical protein